MRTTKKIQHERPQYTVKSQHLRVLHGDPVTLENVPGGHQSHFVGVHPLDDDEFARSSHRHVPALNDDHGVLRPKLFRPVQSAPVAA